MPTSSPRMRPRLLLQLEKDGPGRFLLPLAVLRADFLSVDAAEPDDVTGELSINRHAVPPLSADQGLRYRFASCASIRQIIF